MTEKLGHDYQLKDHKDATCTEAGYDYYECSRDALHNYTEAIPATDHMYGKEVVEPTCTEPGYTKYTCAYCGDSYTTDEKPELGHEEVVISGQNPTCEAEGWTESSYCKRCNVTLKAKEIISAQGHDPIAVPGKEPTCTETGLTEGSKCQRCGKTLTAQETIPALGHDWNTTSTGVDNCVNVSFRHENETITLCPICGVQNGTQRLNKVTLYTAHAKLVVLRGVLENGMEAMTVAFYEPGISSVTACQRCGAVRDSFSSGASLPQAAENAHFTVDASLVDGYTVMLVQADGTETVIQRLSKTKFVFACGKKVIECDRGYVTGGKLFREDLRWDWFRGLGCEEVKSLNSRDKKYRLPGGLLCLRDGKAYYAETGKARIRYSEINDAGGAIAVPDVFYRAIKRVCPDESLLAFVRPDGKA